MSKQRAQTPTASSRRCRKDAFDILGLPFNSPQEKVKQAFHQLALQLHPDKCTSPNAHGKFLALHDAYKVASISGSNIEKVSDDRVSARMKAFEKEWASQADSAKQAAEEQWNKQCRNVRRRASRPSNPPMAHHSIGAVVAARRIAQAKKHEQPTPTDVSSGVELFKRTDKETTLPRLILSIKQLETSMRYQLQVEARCAFGLLQIEFLERFGRVQLVKKQAVVRNCMFSS